eukprot:TRINITY_DN4837_c0_g2_i1.p2 TRINITY_DN4837_c0_g2~~TRINITY_DN4837_c0_g2_i1.p2  ORF type:complete len:162 (+),score=32.54 TRINITY_DN4837_c0_g2_i1:218-703(+)
MALNLENHPDVKATEEALLAAIRESSERGDSQYAREYTRPGESVWAQALASEELPCVLEQLGDMVIEKCGHNGMMDASDASGITRQLYELDVFGVSGVDAEKDAYFAALMNCYCDHQVHTRMLDAAAVTGAIRFLFDQRTLLAASYLNRGKFGANLVLEAN